MAMGPGITGRRRSGMGRWARLMAMPSLTDMGRGMCPARCSTVIMRMTMIGITIGITMWTMTRTTITTGGDGGRVRVHAGI